MKTAWSPIFSCGLPEDHRFPMAKYELIPKQLLYEGTLLPEDLFEPPPASDELLLLTHAPEYLHRWQNLALTVAEVRRSGFPQSTLLIERERRIAQGTLMAALFALTDGIAFNVAGGTHHAFRDSPEGFCLLNDIAVTANALLHEKRLDRIMIIDLDVHQGNGTAAILGGDERVFTFSMHCGANFPYRKETSNLDISLPIGCSDALYLERLEDTLKRIVPSFNPELIIYQAGVDILETDRLGKLNISQEGCMARDRLVLEACKARGIPIVATMGGSYSPDLNHIVNAHCNTFRVARRLFGH